ncbi:hypothetical protein VSU01S_00830 [Vibrio superstes NBRC 103154]|uniref:GyrI-like small molecule binding domain-containing protein n=1 Tax=Vibrio superstes NBRC 103154 TaxID=1219062 RepID=A0A511QKI5_9VIBR|nr:hypothetical protein VSU01S_00830 [Vibrio superstes NBRC 103154]
MWAIYFWSMDDLTGQFMFEILEQTLTKDIGGAETTLDYYKNNHPVSRAIYEIRVVTVH